MPKEHWGASYEAGNSVVLLSFSCYSPIILARKNDHVKLSIRNERIFPLAHWHRILVQNTKGIVSVACSSFATRLKGQFSI